MIILRHSEWLKAELKGSHEQYTLNPFPSFIARDYILTLPKAYLSSKFLSALQFMLSNVTYQNGFLSFFGECIDLFDSNSKILWYNEQVSIFEVLSILNRRQFLTVCELRGIFFHCQVTISKQILQIHLAIPAGG